MERFNDILTTLNGIFWGWPMVVTLFGCHLFLTIRLKVPQRKLLTGIKLSIAREVGASGDISQFGALVTSLAATVGIGNIVGVATAISLGGPGAVMWCWLSGLLGIATKYTEALLSVKYRVKGDDGNMNGGPMYVIERGLGHSWRPLAIMFAVFTIAASFGVGSTVQANAFAEVLVSSIGVPKYISGIFLSVSIGAVLLFGIKGIATICTRLIPFMVVLYIAGSLVLLFINSEYLWPAIKLIVSSAFSPRAAGGGFVGASIMVAARFGIARGLFSNESGLGSAPIVAAAARSRNSVRQALVSSTGTFWDTVIICALTGVVLVSSILADPSIGEGQVGLLTEMAFRRIPYVGTLVLGLSLTTFSFSTILSWSYYTEKAVQYLGGKSFMRIFFIVWIVVIFCGAILDLHVVWNIADLMNAFMALPNIVSLIMLSGVAAKETGYYLWSNHLDEVDPSIN